MRPLSNEERIEALNLSCEGILIAVHALLESCDIRDVEIKDLQDKVKQLEEQNNE